MPTRKVAAGVVALITAATVAGCSSPPEPQPVTLLAGGGDRPLTALDGEPSAGTDVSLPGKVSGLTSQGNGTVWGALDSHLLEIGADGSVQLHQVGERGEFGGPRGFRDLAVAPDGTVYFIPGGSGAFGMAGNELVAVYRADENFQPQPVYGEPGSFGSVTDIAVEPDGRLVFVENVNPGGPGGSDFEPHQVRRLESDGSVTTLAGAEEVSGDSESEDVATYRALPDGLAADELPLYDNTALAVGGDDTIYLGTGRAVAAIGDDGILRHLVGTVDDEQEDYEVAVPLDVTFSDPEPLAEAGYVQPDLLGRTELTANGSGSIVVPFLVNKEDVAVEDVVSWRIDGGDDRITGMAESAWSQTKQPRMLIDAGESEAVLATVLGRSAAWLDDDTLAVAAGGDDESVVVTIDVP